MGGFREGLSSEEEENNVEERQSKEEKDVRLRRMEPNLGKAGIREGLSEEERRTLSNWLEEFSCHIHLPPAYQMNHFKVRPADQSENELKSQLQKKNEPGQ